MAHFFPYFLDFSQNYFFVVNVLNSRTGKLFQKFWKFSLHLALKVSFKRGWNGRNQSKENSGWFSNRCSWTAFWLAYTLELFFQYSQSKCESEGPNKLSNVKHHFENSTQPVGSAANSILIEQPKVADLLDTTVPGWWCWCLKAWLCPLLTACCLGQRMGDKKSWLRYGVTGKLIENATHDTDRATYIVRPRILK